MEDQDVFAAVYVNRIAAEMFGVATNDRERRAVIWDVFYGPLQEMRQIIAAGFYRAA